MWNAIFSWKIKCRGWSFVNRRIIIEFQTKTLNSSGNCVYLVTEHTTTMRNNTLHTLTIQKFV